MFCKIVDSVNGNYRYKYSIGVHKYQDKQYKDLKRKLVKNQEGIYELKLDDEILRGDSALKYVQQHNFENNKKYGRGLHYTNMENVADFFYLGDTFCDVIPLGKTAEIETGRKWKTKKINIMTMRPLSDVKTFIYMMENGARFDNNGVDGICTFAAARGYFEVLKWLHGNGFKCDKWTIWSAAKYGHFEIVKWLCSIGCPTNSICEAAAIGGYLKILKWARENNYFWNEYVCRNAAAHNRLILLKWARDNGCPWNSWTISDAILTNNFDIAKWAHDNGCPCDEMTHKCVNMIKLPDGKKQKDLDEILEEISKWMCKFENAMRFQTCCVNHDNNQEEISN